MNKFRTSYITYILIGLVVGSMSVLLTPIRYTDLVLPTIQDVPPQEYYDSKNDGDTQYLLIDVRGESSYNNLHAENSINMPLHTLYDERHNLPKDDVEIVLICSGGRASGVGYSYLEHYGFTNISRIEGGIESWVEAGLPTSSNNENEESSG